jgi:hypothetical protein
MPQIGPTTHTLSLPQSSPAKHASPARQPPNASATTITREARRDAAPIAFDSYHASSRTVTARSLRSAAHLT